MQHIKNDQSIIKSLPVPERSSEDTFVNGNGRKLLKLMSDYDLLPANGSIIGDLAGRYSCVTWNGMSCNDTFIFHRSYLNRINYFKIVGPFEWYSDHKSISVSIRVNLSNDSNNKNHLWKKLNHKKMIWDTESISKFKTILERDDTKNKLDHFTNVNFNNSDDAAENFTSILAGVLDETFPSQPNRRRNGNSANRREGFSYKLYICLKNLFRKIK